MPGSPRLAVRAIIVENGRLLLVNAYSGGSLWCAPGGGVEMGASLSDNLAREVWEETGLSVGVGDLVGVNEFHEPKAALHQVDLFFRAKILSGVLNAAWRDPDAVVTERQFFSASELSDVRFKPDMLPDLAFGDPQVCRVGALERLIR